MCWNPPFHSSLSALFLIAASLRTIGVAIQNSTVLLGQSIQGKRTVEHSLDGISLQGLELSMMNVLARRKLKHAFSADLEAALGAYQQKVDLEINKQIREEYQKLIEMQTSVEARKRLNKRYPNLGSEKITAILDPTKKTRKRRAAP